eukprot:18821_1
MTQTVYLINFFTSINIPFINYNDDKIIENIAQYAIGNIVNCCLCKTKIMINNQLHFKRKIESQHNEEIYYYKPVSAENQMLETVSLFNENVRIFCAHCTKNKLTKCNYIHCDYKEISDNLFAYKQSGKRVCHEHLKVLCILCDDIWSTDYVKKCNICNKNAICIDCLNNKMGMALDNYNYQCNACSVHIETNKLFSILYEIISCNMDSNLIQIITDHSIGCFATCCNLNCENEIVFNSQFEFEHIDNIHYYEIYKGLKYIHYQTLYNKKLRIFCQNCTKNHLKQCEVIECKHKDVGNYMNGAFACRSHTICWLCCKFYARKSYQECDECGRVMLYRRPPFFL